MCRQVFRRDCAPPGRHNRIGDKRDNGHPIAGRLALSFLLIMLASFICSCNDEPPNELTCRTGDPCDFITFAAGSDLHTGCDDCTKVTNTHPDLKIRLIYVGHLSNDRNMWQMSEQIHLNPGEAKKAGPHTKDGFSYYIHRSDFVDAPSGEVARDFISIV